MLFQSLMDEKWDDKWLKAGVDVEAFGHDADVIVVIACLPLTFELAHRRPPPASSASHQQHQKGP